jgi:hypothetical protein
MATAPQYLIVVRPDAPELLERLQATADAGIEVIVDRRRRDRRVIIQDVTVERRRRERRALVDPTWDSRGFFLARLHRAARETNGHNGHRTCLEIPAAATFAP